MFSVSDRLSRQYNISQKLGRSIERILFCLRLQYGLSNTYLHTGWSDQVTEFGSKARMRQTNHFYFSEPPRSFLKCWFSQTPHTCTLSMCNDCIYGDLNTSFPPSSAQHQYFTVSIPLTHKTVLSYYPPTKKQCLITGK